MGICVLYRRDPLAKPPIATAFEMGWAEFGNGNLLLEAEARFNELVTTDQNLRYQQNLVNRRLAILVLPFASWPNTRTTQIEDCGCDRGSEAWRLPRFDAALIVFRWSPPSSHAGYFRFPFPS
jgi:hypothetical protein